MNEALRELLGADPIPWLLSSKEPHARWVTHRFLMDEPAEETTSDRIALLGDPDVAALIDALPDWGEEDPSGHHSPAFLPNRLNLLADMGVAGGDAAQIEVLLDSLLEHQDRTGRFQSFGGAPTRPRPEWGALLCDTNAITDVLLRFGREDDERVIRALKRMTQDATATNQGHGWRCVPEKTSLFRGPGRVTDTCPQVTLEGLRAFSQLPEELRPATLLDAARTPLEIWRRRVDERPYEFGHGYQFKSVKWPNFWYDVLWVLETVSRFPQLWDGPTAREEDREALAEMAACLIAYNFDDDARVTPKRVYQGFERFSFGLKTEPSPFATARALVPLTRMVELAEQIARVDVEGLPSSKGGSGVPVPPRRQPRVCPTPTQVPRFPASRAVPRVLARHHIATPHVPTSIESLVADTAALHSTFPSTPYLAIAARLPGFTGARLDTALYERRSLARVRCMRGSVFVVRHDLVLPALAATRRPVIRHARDFAARRGVTATAYGQLVPRILAILAEKPLTTAALRTHIEIPDGVDLAALVSLMAAESLVLRDRPLGGWHDRHWTYVPFDQALPDVKLDSMTESEGDYVLLRAYVRAFGPATRRDAGWWTGMGVKRVELALDYLGDEIVDVVLDDDESYLMHAADIDELSSAAMIQRPQVALLPVLDPLLMGYARKDRFVSDALRPYVFDRTGNATSTVLVNGGVVGVWDVAPEPEPQVLLHIAVDVEGDIDELIEERAVQAGVDAVGESVGVVRVRTMTPLATRAAGSFAHPLR